jgi:transposase-like protein
MWYRRNSDREIRHFERQRSLGDQQAEAALLVRRIRQEQLDPRHVELAAYLKHPASLLIFPEPELPLTGALDNPYQERWYTVTAQVLRRGNLDQKLAVAVAADFAEHVLPNWDAYDPNDDRPALAIDAARDFVREEATDPGNYSAFYAGEDARRAGDDVYHGLMFERRLAEHAANAAAQAAYAAAANLQVRSDESYAAYAARAARFAAGEGDEEDEIEAEWQRQHFISVLLGTEIRENPKRYRYNPLNPKKEKAIKDALHKGGIIIRDLDTYVTYLVDADPTKNKKYASWIVKQIVSGQVDFPEDVDMVNELLTDFHQKKHLLPADKRDINRYKTRGQLAATLDQHLEHRSKRGALASALKELNRGAELFGVEIFFKMGDFTVLMITDPNIASELTQNTRLCVRDAGLAAYYIKNSPLYFILENGEPLAMLYIGGSDDDATAQELQFRDRYDDRLEKEELTRLRPISKKIVPSLGSLSNVSIQKYLSYLAEILGDFDKVKQVEAAQAQHMADYAEENFETAGDDYNREEQAEWMREAETEEIEDLQERAAQVLRGIEVLRAKAKAADKMEDWDLSKSYTNEEDALRFDLEEIRDHIIDLKEEHEGGSDDVDFWVYRRNTQPVYRGLRSRNPDLNIVGDQSSEINVQRRGNPDPAKACLVYDDQTYCGKHYSEVEYYLTLVELMRLKEDDPSLILREAVCWKCLLRMPSWPGNRKNPRYEEVANWRKAVKKLLDMGFKRSELAKLLCESLRNSGIKCGTRAATGWFRLGGRSRGARRPPPFAQKTIVKMAKILKPIPWREAIEDLVSVGYSINKIAYLLHQKIDVTRTSITRYLYGYRRPSLETQEIIVETADEFIDIDAETIIVPKDITKKLPKRVRSLSPQELDSKITEARLRARAVKLREQGMSKRDICRRLSIGEPRLNALLKDTKSPRERRKEEVLRLLSSAELSNAEIARKMGATRQSVSRWAASMPDSRVKSRSTKEERERAVTLCNTTDMSYNEIGRLFSRQGTTIMKWCADTEGSLQRAKQSAETLKEKREIVEELCRNYPDLSFAEISRRVGVSDRSVKRWCEGIRSAKPRTPPGAKEAAFQLFLTTNLPNTKIGKRVGVSGRTIGIWRKYFRENHCDVCGEEVLGRFKRHPTYKKRYKTAGR